MDDVFRAANWLAKSDLLQPSLRGRPADIAVVMLMGLDLRLSAAAALRGIHVIDGKAAVSSDLMAGVAWGSGKCERIDYLEWTDEVCRVSVQRIGSKPIEASFSMEEAKRITIKGGMKLADKDNYKNWRRDMMKARALARGLRAAFPDLLFGIYVPEELDDVLEAPQTTAPMLPDGLPVAPKKRGSPAFSRNLDDLPDPGADVVDGERVADPTTAQKPVTVDTSTSQVEDQSATVAPKASTPASEPTKDPQPEAAPPAQDAAVEKLARGKLALSIGKHSVALGPAETAVAYEAVKVSESIESLDLLTLKQLEALNLALAQRWLKIGGAAPAAAADSTAAAVPQAPETTSQRELRLIGIARSREPDKFKLAIERRNKKAGSPAASWPSEVRRSILDEVFGENWPA